MEIIAKIGVKAMVIPNTDLETSRASLQTYVEQRHKAGFGPVDSRLAVWTFCAESEEEARGPAEKYMHGYADTALRHYELLAGHLSKLKGYEGYAARSAAIGQDASAFAKAFIGGHPWGTPETIIERTRELAEAFGTSEITFVFRYGGMPQELAQKSMNLFAKEVLPAIKELNPAPLSGEMFTA